MIQPYPMFAYPGVLHVTQHATQRVGQRVGGVRGRMLLGENKLHMLTRMERVSLARTPA